MTLLLRIDVVVAGVAVVVVVVVVVVVAVIVIAIAMAIVFLITTMARKNMKVVAMIESNFKSKLTRR